MLPHMVLLPRWELVIAMGRACPCPVLLWSAEARQQLWDALAAAQQAPPAAMLETMSEGLAPHQLQHLVCRRPAPRPLPRASTEVPLTCASHAAPQLTDPPCFQEADAAASVEGQMQAFRQAMAKDGASQRSEAQRIVQGLTQRAQALVDDTLKVSAWRSWRGFPQRGRSRPTHAPAADTGRGQACAPCCACPNGTR